MINIVVENRKIDNIVKQYEKQLNSLQSVINRLDDKSNTVDDEISKLNNVKNMISNSKERAQGLITNISKIVTT